MLMFLLSVPGFAKRAISAIFLIILDAITVQLYSNVVLSDKDMYHYVFLWLLFIVIERVAYNYNDHVSWLFDVKMEQEFNTLALEKYKRLNYETKNKEPLSSYRRKIANVMRFLSILNNWGMNAMAYAWSGTVDIWVTLSIFPSTRMTIFVIMTGILYYLVTDKSLNVVMKKRTKDNEKLSNQQIIVEGYFELGKKSVKTLLDIVEMQCINQRKVSLEHSKRINIITVGELTIMFLALYMCYCDPKITSVTNVIRSLVKFSNGIKVLSRFVNEFLNSKDTYETYNKFWEENEKNILEDVEKLPFPDGLTIKSIDFKRPNSSYQLKCDKEFHLPLGSVVSLRGDTATGKSTLINLLLGRDATNDNAGAVNLAQGLPRQFAHHVTECGQTSSDRLNWSISTPRDHFDGEIDNEKIYYFCDITCIGDKIRGMDMDEPISNSVSGGEQQRITLASNLYYAYGGSNSTRMLILDEPEKGLGKMAKKVIENILHMSESRNNIIIISTHDEKLSASLFTHHVFLEKIGNMTVVNTHP